MSSLLEQHSITAGRMDGVDFARLAKEFGTPLYVYSGSALKRNVRELQSALQGSAATICFAVKACSNLSILRLMGEQGLGADIVSGGELARARLAGIPPAKIVFSGVGKTDEEIQTALQAGIHSFNSESVPELTQISRIAVKLGKTANIALRFNPDVNAKTHPYISTGLRENKFGITRSEILAALPQAVKLPGIRIAGLSIHIGSQLLSLAPLEDAFRITAQLQTELAKRGVRLQFIDLGGGLGIQYRKEKTPPLKKYGALVRKYFPQTPVTLEPGRLLVGNAGILLSKVLIRKERGKRAFLVVDAAMNDLLRPALYQSHHEILAVHPFAASGKMASFDVVGPVCETSDCFGRNRKLPPGTAPDHLVALLSAGAYGFSMASTYNSRPRPAEVLVEAGTARLIRKRETTEELFAAEQI